MDISVATSVPYEQWEACDSYFISEFPHKSWGHELGPSVYLIRSCTVHHRCTINCANWHVCFSVPPFAQQVVIIIEDSGDSKWTKGQTRYFQIFQKILGIWVHKTLQRRHAWVLASGMRNLKHVSRNTDQFLELRLRKELITIRHCRN